MILNGMLLGQIMLKSDIDELLRKRQMRFIAVTPTKGGQHEAKSTHLNVESIHCLDSGITDEIRAEMNFPKSTETMIEVVIFGVEITYPVEETVQEILDAIKAAEDI